MQMHTALEDSLWGGCWETLQECVRVRSGMFVPVKRGPVFSPAWAPVMLQTPWIWTSLLLSCVLTSHTADGLKSLFL